MRLSRVYIDGFRNLKEVEVNFEQSCLTTVIIGQNAAGKSNLIEAIAEVFRGVDLNERNQRFIYEIDFQIRESKVRMSNRSGEATIFADGAAISRTAFEA